MADHAIYSCHGLTIDSDLPLNEAFELSHGEADVHLRQETIPANLAQAACEGACFQARADAYLLDVPEVGRYLVRDGRTIGVQSRGTPTAVRHFLHGSPMAALLLQRGRLVFQGSAVRTPRGAVLILGPPASGKSVLAAAFHRAGCAVLADDVCSFAFDPPKLHPGPSYVCLWGRDAARLGLSEGGVPVRPDLNRLLFPTERGDPNPVPLFAICALDSWNEEKAHVEPVVGAARLHVLLANLYNRLVLEACGEPRHHLSKVSALAQVPCFQVWRPRGSWSVEPLVSRLHDVLDL